MTTTNSFCYNKNMALRVKVFPHTEFLEKFLKGKNLELVEEYPQILHYAGFNLKELKTVCKIDKPEFLITHNISGFKDFPATLQVYYPLKSERELLQVRKAYTNSFKLCKHYFERIGLQAEIIEFPPKQKQEAAEPEVNFRLGVGRFANIWNTFKSWMNW